MTFHDGLDVLFLVAGDDDKASDVRGDAVVLGRRKLDRLHASFDCALAVEWESLVNVVLSRSLLDALIDRSEDLFVTGRCFGEIHASILPSAWAYRLAALRSGDRCGSIHERQVAKALREVPEEVSRQRIDLLGVQTDVVRKPDQLAHERACLLDLPFPGQRLHEPEGARDERSLDLLLSAVSVEERTAGAELAPDRVDRGTQTIALRIDKADPCHPQETRVELAGARVHDVRATIIGPALALDELAGVVGGLAPAIGVLCRQLVLLDELQRTSEGEPCSDLGRGVVLLVVELPDAGVLLFPDLGELVDDSSQPLRRGVVERIAVTHVQLRRIEKIAVAAELQLSGGFVSAPEGPRAPIAPELELLLPRGRLAVEVVEHVNVRLGALDGSEQPRERRVYLDQQLEVDQSVERVRRIADPGEAVVVVAIAADPLGQRGGRSGDDRAARHVGQHSQDECTPPRRVLPLPLDRRVVEPASPVVGRVVHAARDPAVPRRRNRLVLRRAQDDQGSRAPRRLERTADLVLGADRLSPAERVHRHHELLPLDGDRTPDSLEPRALFLLSGRESRRDPPAKRNRAGKAFDTADELEPGQQSTVVERDRICDPDAAALRRERRPQHVAVPHVLARDLVARCRRELERAA